MEAEGVPSRVERWPMGVPGVTVSKAEPKFPAEFPIEGAATSRIPDEDDDDPEDARWMKA